MAEQWLTFRFGLHNGLTGLPVTEIGNPEAEYLWKVNMKTTVLCMLHF